MIMKVVTIHTKVSIRATCCSPGWTMILYTHRRCLEVARFRHADPPRRCPFLREDRKSRSERQNGAAKTRKCGPNLKPRRLTRNGRTPGICLSACIIRSSAVRTGLSIRMPAISRSFPAGKPRPEGAPDRSDSPAAVQAGPPPRAFRRARGDRALRDRTQREAWSQPER